MKMKKIFVTGGTGFIGEEVCLGLRRAGHQVTALVRDISKARSLLEGEVKVVVGDLKNPSSYFDYCKNANVIIHTASDYSDYEAIDRKTVETILSINSPEKVFIFTSGILVYPDTGNGLATEETNTVDPSALGSLGARPSIEQIVLNHKTMKTCVVRPSYVFGKKSRHFVHYFDQAAQGHVSVFGNPDIGYSEVHIDDLVDGYKRIVEIEPEKIASQIFNFSDSSRNSNGAIAKAFTQFAGYKGEIKSIPISDKNSFLAVSQKNVYVSSEKAKKVLGWEPKHLPMLDEIELYFQVWKTKKT